MAIALVTHVAGQSSDSNGLTTSAIDTTGANFIVVGLATAATGGAVSDSKSNTWTPLTQWIGNFSDRWFRFFYAQNATVGSGHTFTATGTGIFPSICVASFSGVATSSSFDVENGNATFGNTIATGSITPGSANELLVAGLCYEDASTATIDSSFTITDTVVAGGFGYEGNQFAYLIETTATAKNPTFSCTSNTRLIGAIASFKAAGVAGFTPYNPWPQAAPILAQ